MIKLIVAQTKNGLIGKGNYLPWNIKEELNFFKKMTLNKHILMGKNTFLGLPTKLKNRKIIVLSNDQKNLGDKTINDFNWVLENFQNSKKTIFICGGKSIYEQFYKYANEIYVSEIKKEYEGDVYLNINLSNYKKTLFKEYEEFNVYKYIKEKGEKNEKK